MTSRQAGKIAATDVHTIADLDDESETLAQRSLPINLGDRAA